MTFQIFGSPSSVDVDLVVFVEAITSNKASADLCLFYEKELMQQYEFDRPLNVNVACLKDGAINAVFKGTVDELNNTLFYTYDFHQQYFPQHIHRLVERDVELKMIRCARKILSFLSRTHLRSQVKKALRGSFEDKINLLNTINLSDFEDFGKKGSMIEFRKTIAFQLGQTLALLSDKEVYTKEAIYSNNPKLAPFLKREHNANIKDLQECLDNFIELSYFKLPSMKRQFE